MIIFQIFPKMNILYANLTIANYLTIVDTWKPNFHVWIEPYSSIENGTKKRNLMSNIGSLTSVS